jgi:ASC-1-like (ASCH) protein
MATHHLHLHPKPFEFVRSGQKTIESRLLDEKRQAYGIGDTLIFTNRANESELIETKITHLHKGVSFRELFMSPGTQGKFSTDSLDELLDDVGLYYSKKDQEKYGVVGIEFIVNDKK